MRGLVGGGKATANTLLLTHAAPSPTHTHVQPWANRNVVSVGGIFAAAYYTLCVNVTSVKYHRASAGTVTAAVTVDMVGAGAQITGYFVGTGPMAGPAGAMLDTVATTTISFVGLEMGTATGNATGLVTANYTNGVQTYAAKGCAVINATLMTCTTVPGVGANLLWTVKLRGVTVPALVPLLTSYYAPTVTSLANTTGLPSGGGTNGVGLAPGATTQPQNMAAGQRLLLVEARRTAWRCRCLCRSFADACAPERVRCVSQRRRSARACRRGSRLVALCACGAPLQCQCAAARPAWLHANPLWWWAASTPT